MSDQIPLKNGSKIADYQVVQHLGTGGFGITYRVQDPSLGVEFALKEYFPWEFAVRDAGGIVRPKQGFESEFQWGLEKFKSEGQMLASLSLRHDSSPYIVKVYRFLEDLGTAYLVQEFVSGKPLLDFVNSIGDPREIEVLFEKLCSGLSYIHSQDVCHLDIKPDNILVSSDTKQPKLIDFGSAKRNDSTRTVALITPHFSACEQYSADAEHGPFTDIYALSATFFRILSGENPPDAPSRVLDDRCKKLSNEPGFSNFSKKFLRQLDIGMAVFPRERPDTIEQWLERADARQPVEKADVRNELAARAIAAKEELAPRTRSVFRAMFSSFERSFTTLASLGIILIAGAWLLNDNPVEIGRSDSDSLTAALNTKTNEQRVSEPQNTRPSANQIDYQSKIYGLGKSVFTVSVDSTSWTTIDVAAAIRESGIQGPVKLTMGSQQEFLARAGGEFLSASGRGPNYGKLPSTLDLRSIDDRDAVVSIEIEAK